jgi:hypothetical protein
MPQPSIRVLSVKTIVTPVSKTPIAVEREEGNFLLSCRSGKAFYSCQCGNDSGDGDYEKSKKMNGRSKKATVRE